MTRIKRTYYTVCEYCGAHLDPGEKCDCRKSELLNGNDTVSIPYAYTMDNSVYTNTLNTNTLNANTQDEEKDFFFTGKKGGKEWHLQALKTA